MWHYTYVLTERQWHQWVNTFHPKLDSWAAHPARGGFLIGFDTCTIKVFPETHRHIMTVTVMTDVPASERPMELSA